MGLTSAQEYNILLSGPVAAMQNAINDLPCIPKTYKYIPYLKSRSEFGFGNVNASAGLKAASTIVSMYLDKVPNFIKTEGVYNVDNFKDRSMWMVFAIEAWSNYLTKFVYQTEDVASVSSKIVTLMPDGTYVNVGSLNKIISGYKASFSTLIGLSPNDDAVYREIQQRYAIYRANDSDSAFITHDMLVGAAVIAAVVVAGTIAVGAYQTVGAAIATTAPAAPAATTSVVTTETIGLETVTAGAGGAAAGGGGAAAGGGLTAFLDHAAETAVASILVGEAKNVINPPKPVQTRPLQTSDLSQTIPIASEPQKSIIKPLLLAGGALALFLLGAS